MPHRKGEGRRELGWQPVRDACQEMGHKLVPRRLLQVCQEDEEEEDRYSLHFALEGGGGFAPLGLRGSTAEFSHPLTQQFLTACRGSCRPNERGRRRPQDLQVLVTAARARPIVP